jgi:hypothetical protein
MEKVKIKYSKVESVFMKQFKKEYAALPSVVLVKKTKSYVHKCTN